MGIFRKRKSGTPLSAALNVVGMTVAFAALYIILVQVHHDLFYNREVKDSERGYCVSLPDRYGEGKYMFWLPRPLVEEYMSTVPEIEAGGTCYLFSQSTEMIVGDAKNPSLSAPRIVLGMSAMSDGALDVFGFELAEGSWDSFVGARDIAFSESAERKYGLSVGSRILLKDWRSGEYG